MRRLKLVSIITILLLLFSGLVFAGNKSPMFARKGLGGMFGVVDETQTTGNIWFVDSGSSTASDAAGYGQNPDAPFATVDYAIGSATANNGDWIVVMPGHAESYSAADGFDADVAGIRIIGLGEGATRPTFTFADTDATVAIGAANVTIENVRFVAGISDIVIGIAVEAGGDNFTLKNCDFPEPTTNTFDFLDAIDLASGADGVSIIDNTYSHYGTTGPNHFVEMGNGVNKNFTFRGNRVIGQFAVAAIWSDTIDLDVFIFDNNITQLTASQFGIEFTGNATGICAYNTVNAATATYEIDPGAMRMFMNNTGTALPETVSEYDLFGAFTGDGGASQNDSVKASLDLAHTDLDAILAATPGGLAYFATVTSSADTTHSVYSALTGHGDGFFVGGWTMIVVYDAGGANAAPEGEVVDVTGYTSTTGTFTHGATTQLAAGDKVLFVRDELVSIYQKALPTTPVTNSLAYRLSQYLASGDGDWATGTALPSNVSLYDVVKYLGYLTTSVVADADLTSYIADKSALSHVMTKGADTSAYAASTDSLEALSDKAGGFSGDGGAAQDDSVKASLDLAHTDLDAILADSAALDDMKEKSVSKAVSTIANGNNDLFEVANGPIKILEIVAYVTTEIGAESIDIYYTIDVDAPAGGDTDFGTDGDGLVIDGDAVGTVYTWTGVIAADLIATTNGVALGVSAAGSAGLIVPPGMIELTAVHDGTCAGAITVYMRYIPLATGVTVTAAP